MAGRPTLYSTELATQICAELAEGRPLVTICKRDEMPNVASIYRWLAAYPDFLTLYNVAREDQADTLADQIIAIADDKDDDWIDTPDGKKFNLEHVQRSRLRVDARKFIAAKLKPKKYGELVKHEHGGENGSPIPVSIMVSYAKPGQG